MKPVISEELRSLFGERAALTETSVVMGVRQLVEPGRRPTRTVQRLDQQLASFHADELAYLLRAACWNSLVGIDPTFSPYATASVLTHVPGQAECEVRAEAIDELAALGKHSFYDYADASLRLVDDCSARIYRAAASIQGLADGDPAQDLAAAHRLVRLHVQACCIAEQESSLMLAQGDRRGAIEALERYAEGHSPTPILLLRWLWMALLSSDGHRIEKASRTLDECLAAHHPAIDAFLASKVRYQRGSDHKPVPALGWFPGEDTASRRLLNAFKN